MTELELAEIRERLLRRKQELANEPPLETVQKMLRSYEYCRTWKQLRINLQGLPVEGLKRRLTAFERLLTEPLPPGTLTDLVAWDANHVLDFAEDEQSHNWLAEYAGVIRDVITDKT